MDAIRTEKLSKYYGTARGIIDVDLAVEKGDFYGFIGPNGAGKSTLIRTLLGIISKTSGSASVLNFDCSANKNEILTNVGYLPAEASFYNRMTVSELIRFSAKLRKRDCKREADELIERLRLEPDKKIGQLSLGNRKKVGIVCAMQHKPELYILDEPTSGLDPLIQREVFELLHERNNEGATVFLSTHVLSEIDHHCKHAGIIREGRLLLSDAVVKITHTGAKLVTLRGVRELPPMVGVKKLRQENDTVSFVCTEGIKPLLKLLSSADFDDMTVADPDIEEVLMSYYDTIDQKEAK